MSNQRKSVEKYRETPVLRIPAANEKVVHVPSQTEEQPRPRVTIPFLTLFIAFILFMLAWAGPAIGNVLAYLIIPAAGLFPGVLVWEKFGLPAGVSASLLVVAILTPVYGASVIANSISLFTSLQTISQGILVFLGLVTFVFSLAYFFLRTKRGE